MMSENQKTTDVNEIVAATMVRMTADGTIRSLIEKATESAIAQAVNESINGYKFKRELEEAITSSINVNMQTLDLPGYNMLVSEIIKTKLHGFFAGTGTEMIEKQMEELLDGFPAEIKLSDLAERFREFCAEDIEEWESGECTIIVQQSRSSDGYFDISFDKEPNKSWYQCAYRVRCRAEGVWAVTIDNEKPKNKLFLGPLGEFERFLFRAYTNKVKVIFDETDLSITYGRSDY